VTTPEPPAAGTSGTDPLGTDPLGTDPLGAQRTTAAPGAGAPLREREGSTGVASAKRPRRRGRAAGLGLVAALLVFVTVVLVLFVLFNTQTVRVSLVFGVVDAPLVIALLVAAGLGGLLVALAAATLRARASRRSG
jgi:uncharacterized integral membrane protein